jgi:hypothetical protein
MTRNAGSNAWKNLIVISVLQNLVHFSHARSVSLLQSSTKNGTLHYVSGNGTGTMRPMKMSRDNNKLSLDQNLLICNAFAVGVPLDVYPVHVMTEARAIHYKECRDFWMPFEEGDQITFKANGIDIGTFWAAGLPEISATLLLVPYRRDANSMDLAFSTHVFSANDTASQVAVVDAYIGSEKGYLRLSDEDNATETLRFNSVATIGKGHFTLGLYNSETSNSLVKDPVIFDAYPGGKYAAIRIGFNTDKADQLKFPQDVIVVKSGQRRAEENANAIGVIVGSFAAAVLFVAFVNLFAAID